MKHDLFVAGEPAHLEVVQVSSGAMVYCYGRLGRMRAYDLKLVLTDTAGELMMVFLRDEETNWFSGMIFLTDGEVWWRADSIALGEAQVKAWVVEDTGAAEKLNEKLAKMLLL